MLFIIALSSIKLGLFVEGRALAIIMSDPMSMSLSNRCTGLHEPLLLLESFLSSEMTLDTNPSVISSITSPNGDSRSRGAPETLETVFRVADFLFGSTLEGAISILDGSETLITRIISAPSQRTAYLVTSSNGCARNNTKPSNKYLCLIPREKDGDDASCCNKNYYYCSCRSFMDKNARSRTLHPCKHLLALILLPHVGVACRTIETLSDAEFGKMLVNGGSCS